VKLWITFRKSEYGRLGGPANRPLHQRPEIHVAVAQGRTSRFDGRKALKALLSANKRLNTAYVLKESFGQTV